MSAKDLFNSLGQEVGQVVDSLTDNIASNAAMNTNAAERVAVENKIAVAEAMQKAENRDTIMQIAKYGSLLIGLVILILVISSVAPKVAVAFKKMK